MVKVNNENFVSSVYLDGRIDSTNAPEVEKEILSNIESGVKKIIVDAEKLEYISSAGLRVYLSFVRSAITLI